MSKLSILALSVVLVAGCLPQRPAGWGEKTHGKDAEPDYGVVFADGQVKRIDVKLDPADWQAMLDDMTDMYGAFGAGGGQNQEVPPEIIEACAGKNEGDACSVLLQGTEHSATCAWIWENQLGCAIDMPAQDMPPEMVEACDGLSEGSACIAPVGTPVPGTCLEDTQLFCVPDLAIEACGGKQAGQECPVPDGTGACREAGGILFCAAAGQGGMPDGGEMMGGDRDPVWVPCTVAFEGTTWWHVGIRFKGNSSLRHTWQAGIYKLPFKFDMDEFEDAHPAIDDQRFYGFKRLSFANNVRDSSYLHEKVAGDLLAEAGVPTPDRAFYRVYIDVGDGPVYFGLYTMVEVPGQPMLETYFGADTGNLYKPYGRAATWQAGLDVDEQSFSKKTNEELADWSDVEAAIEALHTDRSDPAAWRDAFEKHFDVDGFLRWLAANTVFGNWDSYGNSPHNYYIYHDPADSRFHWIPWDLNESFDEYTGIRPPLALDMSGVGDDWPLIRFVIDDPVYQEAYWNHVVAFAEGAFSTDAIRRRLQAEHDLIAPYVTGTDGEQAPHTLLESPAVFDDSLEYLFSHVEDRHFAVEQAVGP